MCGRYVFVPNPSFVQDYEIENDNVELLPNYNVAPGQIMPIVTMNSPKALIHMKWGLVPYWAKDASFAFKTINARSEEVDQKASYRQPLKNKRCLIPSSGFYEWDRKGREKVPYLFILKERTNFCFAGLFDIWKDGAGKEIYTYTILTTRANGLVGEIHDRMPVILRREDEEVWADNTTYDSKILARLMGSYSAEGMNSYRVSNKVNSTANNFVELLDKDL